MFKKLLSVLCSATVAASVMAWGALCAYADGTTAYGVTTSTSYSGDTKTVTMTSTSKENTSGGSWFYIGKVEVTDALTKVTITIGENAYGSNATGGAQQDWVDSETGTISSTNYDSLFNGSGNQSNPANAFLEYDSSTATAAHSGDVTSNVTSNKQTDGYCYLYAWVNKGSIPVTVTATYDTTPAVEGTFAAAAWGSTNDEYEVDSGTTNILTHKSSGTKFYGYSATVTTTGSGSYSSATIYDSAGTKKGSYGTPTITGSGTETVFYLITKSAITGYTVKVD